MNGNRRSRVMRAPDDTGAPAPPDKPDETGAAPGDPPPEAEPAPADGTERPAGDGAKAEPTPGDGTEQPAGEKPADGAAPAPTKPPPETKTPPEWARDFEVDPANAAGVRATGGWELHDQVTRAKYRAALRKWTGGSTHDE